MSEHCNSHWEPPPEVENLMIDLFQIDDLSKFNLFRQLKLTSHLLSVLTGQYRKDSLSTARMHLLARLLIDQRRSGLMVAREAKERSGVSPSELSQFLRVSRNTISSLLNGLEEQGLIERELHPSDRRQFVIRLTAQGNDLIRERAPEFGLFVESLFEDLDDEERQTLITVLDKLICSLIARAEAMGLDLPIPSPDSTD